MNEDKGRDGAPRVTVSFCRKDWMVIIRSLSILPVALALLAENAVAADRHVTIINSTSTTMKMFFASNVDAKKWEEDILGDEVIHPGDSIDINVDDGTGHCEFDFRALFSDGVESVKNRVDVCKVGNFYFND